MRDNDGHYLNRLCVTMSRNRMLVKLENLNPQIGECRTLIIVGVDKCMLLKELKLESAAIRIFLLLNN